MPSEAYKYHLPRLVPQTSAILQVAREANVADIFERLTREASAFKSPPALAIDIAQELALSIEALAPPILSRDTDIQLII